MQEKKKKIDAAGTKFVLYPGFMSEYLIRVSPATLAVWFGWRVGRKNEFDTAGIDRIKYDFPVSFFAHLQSLFNFEEVFLFQVRPKASVFCVQCSNLNSSPVV